MTAQARGHQQPASESTRSEYVWPVIAVLAVFVALAGMLSYSEEQAKPGYSWVSRLIRSAESVATAEKAAGDRRAEHNRLAEEQRKRYEAWQVEQNFIEVNTHQLSRVYCQNAKTWQSLSEEEKQRIRDHMKKLKRLLIESDACP